jgi:hypothetical protein
MSLTVLPSALPGALSGSLLVAETNATVGVPPELSHLVNEVVTVR